MEGASTTARRRTAGNPFRDAAFWLLCLLLLGPSRAWADWAGFGNFAAVAELAVEPGYAQLNLRMAGDALPRLARLGQLADAAVPPESLARKLVQLQDKNGTPLKGALIDSRHEVGGPREGTSGPAYFEATFRFPLDSPQDTLMLTPPSGASGEIGFIVLDQGIPVNDLAPLRRTVTLRRDPRDPWNSRLDDPALVRNHAEPRSFLYVEPYEVRHELLVRLADLRPWLDRRFQDTGSLDADESADLTKAIGTLLATRTRLAVNGETVTPQIDRVEFVRFTRRGVEPVEPGPLDVNAALVGVVLVHLTDRPADTVRLTWDLFRDAAATRPVSVLLGRESFDSYVTAAQPYFEWSRDEALDTEPQDAPVAMEGAGLPPVEAGEDTREPVPFRLSLLAGLVVPVLAWFAWLLSPRRGIANAGLALTLAAGIAMTFYPGLMEAIQEPAVRLDRHQLHTALTPLLHNAYRAFQVRDEEAVYDRLALSLDGVLLEEAYLQQRRAVLGLNKGLGGEGRVDRIELTQTELENASNESRTCRVMAEWIAHGSVSHWGHSHPRQNRYRAVLTLRIASDRRLKIIAMEFLDGKTLSPGSAS